MGPVELAVDVINYANKNPYGIAGNFINSLAGIEQPTGDAIDEDVVINLKKRIAESAAGFLRGEQKLNPATQFVQGRDLDVRADDIVDPETGAYKEYSTTSGALTHAIPYVVGGLSFYKAGQALDTNVKNIPNVLSKIMAGGTSAVVTENLLYSDNPSETMAGIVADLDDEGVIQLKEQTRDLVEFFHIKGNDSELEKRLRLSFEALAFTGTLGTVLEGIRLGGKSLYSGFIKPAFSKASPEEQAEQAIDVLKQAREEMNVGTLNPTDNMDLSETAEGLAQVEMQNSSFINRFLGKWFTSRGYFTPTAFNLFRDKEYATRQIIQQAENIAVRLQSSLKQLADERPSDKRVMEILTTPFEFDPKASRQFKVNKISNSLNINSDVAEVVLDARELIDGLSAKIVNSNIPDGPLKEVIIQNSGEYIRRSYQMFETPGYKPSKDVTQRFIDQLEAINIKNGMSPEEALRTAKGAVSSLKQNIKDSRGDVFKFFQNISTENKNLLLKRKDLSKIAREFLGEIENPSENVILTATKMARLVENNRFNENLLNIAGGRYLFPAIKKDKKGNVIEGGPVTKTSERSGREINYTEELKIPGSSLNGMFTTPEIKQALEGLQDDWLAESGDWTRAIFGAFAKIKGVSQASKTVYSLSTTARNFMGGPQFALANGVFNLGFRGGSSSIKTLWNEASRGGKKDLDELYETYLRLGVINTNVKIGEFRRTLEDFAKTDSLANWLKKKSDTFIIKAPQDVYMGIDDFFKMNIFNHELKVLMEAFPDEAIEVLEKEAARKVRNNMPNYDLVPPNIKNLRYMPIGNFPAFPSEIIRTSANIVKTAHQEINSGNPILVRRGAARLTGFALIPTIWQGASLTSEYIQGFSEDEARNAQRMSETPWSQATRIFAVVDGQRVAIDTRFIDAYNTIQEPIQRAYSEIISGEMQEKELNEILVNAGIAALQPLIAPYTDQSIVTEALYDMGKTAMARLSDKKYISRDGTVMTSPDMELGDVLGEIAMRGIDSVTPGIVTSVENIFEDEKKREFDRPRKLENLEAIALSGIRMTPFYPDETLFYAAKKYQGSRSQMSSLKPNFQDTDKEEIVEKYKRLLATDYGYQQDLYEVVDAAKSFMSEAEIDRILKQAKIGGDMRDALMNNRAYFSDFVDNNYREFIAKTGFESQEEYTKFLRDMYGTYDAMLRTPLIRTQEKRISERGGPIELDRIEYAKGGEVTDVPQVPVEPDERIDKMTGLPYNQQAGAAFMDEEDPERRLELSAGSIVARLIAKNMPKTKPVLQRSKGEPLSDDTLRPYEEVPEPATYDEMVNALNKRQKEKINIEVPDGQKVGLRLDINAYTNHDTWVPTLHIEPKGTSSHRATASIRNVDLMPTLTDEGKAKKVMEGGAKSPFARIGGNLINRTDEENYRLAQEALNDPEWTQVGFNPDRHSYFFDRATGDPIIAGDEAIQIGPLVLVKNAVRGERKDFMYNEGGLTRRLAKAQGSLYSSVSRFMEEGAKDFFGIDSKALRKHEAETMALVNKLVDDGSLPERERVKVEDGRMLSGDVFNAANHMRLAKLAGDSTTKRALLQGKEYLQQFAGDTGPHGAEGDRRNNALGFDLYDKAQGNALAFEKLVAESLVDQFGSRQAKAKGGKIDKKKMACNKPRRTPNHPKKSHVVKACKDGKEKIIRFGEQGAKTAGKPKAGESKRMKAKRKSFKARHRRNIKKGNMSAAYWADKVKW
jgi:hypothetical protein